MATTERRRSISGFFSFRQEPKVDPENAPRLRRKLQKVTKQTNIGFNTSDTIGVETVKVPGDNSFLSTKYDPVSPVKASDSNSSDDNSRSSRSSREGRSSTSFFRSSSLGRITSFRSRSMSRTRPPSTAVDTAKDTRPVSMAAPVPGKTTRSGSIHVASSAELHAVRAQEKAAQTAVQTRTLQCLEAHERASRRNSFYGNSNNNDTKSTTLSQPLQTPQTPQTAVPVTPPQQMPQFHRPYRPAQLNDVSPTAEKGRKHSYPPRSSNAFHNSMAALHPTLASSGASMKSISSSISSTGSSAVSSSGSSTALSSPTSSTHGPMSSASTLLFSPAYQNGMMPPSPPTSSSSSNCPSDNFAAKSSPFSLAYHRRQYSSINDAPMMPPELSHLVKVNNNSSAGSDSASSLFPSLSPYSMSAASTSVVSSTPSQTRRKKTPVYAVGQLESTQNVSTSGMQTPPRSPRSPRNLLSPRPPQSTSINQVAPPTTGAELSLLQSQSSIECIAAEYRALLASRDSQRTDPQSEAGTDGCRPSPLTTTGRTQSMYESRSATPATTGSEPRAATVYNKSSKLQPSSLPRLSTEQRQQRQQRHSYGQAYTPPPSQADNLSLQISLDMLTRELSSAMGQRPSHQEDARGANGEPGSALQILVMIEAYERLRDQLVAEARASAKANRGVDGRRSRSHCADRAELRSDEIEAMFGLWLRALYRMHDNLTGTSSREKRRCGRGRERDGNVSESEYDSVFE